MEKAGEEGKEKKLTGGKEERKIGACRRKKEKGMRWNEGDKGGRRGER